MDGSCVKLPFTKELQEKYSKTAGALRLDENTARLQEETAKVVRLLEELKGSNAELYSRMLEAGAIKRLTENAPSTDLYRFKIGRVNEYKPNHNGRKYKRKLWENVINKQQDAWKGRVGLADHPPEDSDGEFKNSAIVWHDMEVDENQTGEEPVWAIGSFVGPYGRLGKEIVDAGGKIGFSSSGFGELEYDGSTVNADTFQIERVADIVLNPSQEVFGTSGDALNIEYDGNKPVDGENKTEFVYAEATTRRTNYAEGASRSAIIKENRMDRQENRRPVSSLEEKKFRRDIQTFLEDASKMADPSARLQELTEILTMFEEGMAPDLRESVEAKIHEEKTLLESLVQEALHTRETFDVKSSKDLQVGVALLAEEVKVVEADARDWEAIALALKENNGKLRAALTEANAQLSARPTVQAASDLAKRVAFLEEQRKRQLETFRKESETESEEVGKAKAETAEAKKKVEELTARLIRQKASLREGKEATSLLKSKTKAFNELYEAAKKAAQEGGQMIAKQSESIEQLEKAVENLQAQNASLLAERNKALEDLVAYKEDVERANTPNLAPRFEERVSGYLNFKEGGGLQVEAYWQDLFNRYGEQIKPFERQIRGAKTYKEASTAFIKALGQFDEFGRAAEDARLPESTSLGLKERQTLLEGRGMHFGQPKDIVDRRPGGWV
jgi:hypothetical protein